MARLTWKTVAAPNFNDAAYIMGSAGEDFSRGFAGLGDIAERISTNQKTQAALEAKKLQDAAIKRALVGSDVNQEGNFNRVIAASPAGRLADTIGFLENQSGLVTERVDRGKTVADTGKVYADTEATLVDTQKDRYDLGTAIRDDGRSEEDRTRNQWASETVDDMIYNFGTAEDARKSIAKDENLTAKQRQALFGALDGTDASRFGQDAGAVSEFRSRPEFANVDRVLSAREQELQIQATNNPAIRALSVGLAASSESGGVKNAILSMAKEKLGEDSAYEDSAGELNRQLRTLITDYGGPDGVSEDIISGLFMSEIQSADYIWQGTEDLEPFMKGITGTLDDMKTPEQRARLAYQVSDYKREREALAEDRKAIEKAEALYGSGGYRSGKTGDRLKQEGLTALQSIYERLGTPIPDADTNTDTSKDTSETTTTPSTSRGEEILNEVASANLTGPDGSPVDTPIAPRPTSISPTKVPTLDEYGFDSPVGDPRIEIPPSLQNTPLFGGNPELIPPTAGGFRFEDAIRRNTLTTDKPRVDAATLSKAGWSKPMAQYYLHLLAAQRNGKLTPEMAKTLQRYEGFLKLDMVE